MYRTHNCNELNSLNVGDKVVLSGWVNKRRDFGAMIFIDLRDRYGLTQIVSDPQNFKEAHNLLNTVRSEYVLKIEGVVRNRPNGQSNSDLYTGEIEVLVEKVVILNQSLVPPFDIDKNQEVSEDIRLKYRYLDLRRSRMRDNIILRHDMIKYIRDIFCDSGFLEIETPILIKGTPEGSREYLVPSRLHAGNFYVLPQSPQQLKQLLMVSGFDKYFQIARCFRDEDQRGDRQPEFTQMDLEMSFVEQEDVMKVNEKALIKLTEKFAPDKKMLKIPFPVFTYKEAMNTYGSDKPDIRFDLHLSDVSELVKNSEFSVFSNAVKNGGVVKALRVENGATFTRKDIDELENLAKTYGARGLAYLSKINGEYKSSIVKFFKETELDLIFVSVSAKDGDIVFFTADNFVTACEALGNVRLKLAEKLDLIDNSLFAYLWVIDFPMFERDKETGELNAMHHPFTLPQNPEQILVNPENVIAYAYDIILNGNEVGGGSIRIHDRKIQKLIFDTLGLSEEDTQRRFGHILEAFSYGVPPHGGIAWGLDRLVMLFAGEANIREVMPFPKDQKARDLMLNAPSHMPDAQLSELHIALKLDEK